MSEAVAVSTGPTSGWLVSFFLAFLVSFFCNWLNLQVIAGLMSGCALKMFFC